MYHFLWVFKVGIHRCLFINKIIIIIIFSFYKAPFQQHRCSWRCIVSLQYIKKKHCHSNYDKIFILNDEM